MSQYPDLNFIKYIFVTFKNIEAKNHVLNLFRESACCGIA